MNELTTHIDVTAALAELEVADGRMMDGDWSLWRALLSHRDDVAILGAYGRCIVGWAPVSARFEQTAAGYAAGGGGRSTQELVCSWTGADLACTVTIEHHETRLDGSTDVIPFLYRATHLFRRENDGWKVVLRHADPLVTFVGPQVAHAIAARTGDLQQSERSHNP